MTLQQLIKLIYENEIAELRKQKENGIDFTVLDERDHKNLLIAYAGYGYHEKYSQREMTTFLIECGIDVNHQMNGRSGKDSALHYAVSKGFLEIVKTLVENNANLEIKDSHGNTPLWTSVMNFRNKEGEIEIIKYLLSKGSSLDAKNNHKISPRDLIIRSGNSIDQGGDNKEWDLRFLISK